MYTVIIPIAVLLAVVLIKKIPYIGGNISIGLLLAGFTPLLVGGVYSPLTWLTAWLDGLDRIAWLLFLCFIGCLYGETQVELGTLDTVLRSLRARFGHSPRGLVACTFIVLVIAGSLLGEAIASATIVGILAVKSLKEMGLSAEKICAILVMGACMGSIMPPVSQAMFLSASLMGINPDQVVGTGYFTVGIGCILVLLYICLFLVKKDFRLDESLIPKESAGQILLSNWQNLIPLCVLIFLVLLASLPNELKVTVIPNLLNLIKVNGQPLMSWLSGVFLLKGLTNNVVIILLFVTIFACFFPRVRKNWRGTLVRGAKNVWACTSIQLAAALMLGAFYCAGQIDTVKEFALGLNENLIKLGGSASMTLLGMLTGAQSTAQNAIFSWFGPVLTELGVSPVHAAIAGSHVALAGQGAPPADTVTFCIAGVVGGILKEKVDPLKSMFYSLPFCIYLFIVGIIFLYI